LVLRAEPFAHSSGRQGWLTIEGQNSVAGGRTMSPTTDTSKTGDVQPPERPDGHGAGRKRRVRITIAIGVVAALVAAGIVILVTRDDGTSTKVSSPPATTATTAPVHTSVPVQTDTSTAVWPAASSTTRYTTPVDAATGFATDFVGFVDPVVGEFRAGDSRSGEVPVKPNATGPETTVLVRQLGNDGSWWVLGSSTPNIQVTSPAALANISSPVALHGTSTAFEATVDVEIRADGAAQPVGKGFVMGGANGQMGPFDGSLAFTAPAATGGAVVFSTHSAETGHVAEATVMRVRLT
jgi:Immunoglobulin-like domain of bacterial spore germination